jgi:hypothetical protein
VLSALCHFLTVAAYRRTEASLLSPFLYFNMIAAVGVGFLWFGESPDMVSIIGLSGIACGGLIAVAPMHRMWCWALSFLPHRGNRDGISAAADRALRAGARPMLRLRRESGFMLVRQTSMLTGLLLRLPKAVLASASAAPWRGSGGLAPAHSG